MLSKEERLAVENIAKDIIRDCSDDPFPKLCTMDRSKGSRYIIEILTPKHKNFKKLAEIADAIREDTIKKIAP